MTEAPIACVAPRSRQARTLAGDVARLLPQTRVEAFSLAGYLDAEAPPSRVVLCPAGRSAAGDLDFLARAARRLFWPAPPRRFQQAIGGLRNTEGPARPAGPRPVAGSSSSGLAAALLLEGEVGLARARAALAASAPLAWIVEAPGRVRISRRHLEDFERAGVRWSALEPIRLVALYAAPALARSTKSWKALLPPRTPVWVRPR